MSWCCALGTMGSALYCWRRRRSTGNLFGTTHNTCVSIGSNCSVSVNGTMYRGKNSVRINGKGVYIDGVLQTESTKTGIASGAPIKIEVIVMGDVKGDLRCTGDASINVKNAVGGNVSSSSGSITVGGSCRSIASTSGTIKCKGEVKGNLTSTSGSISVAGSVSGSMCSVSGSVRSGITTKRSVEKSSRRKRERVRPTPKPRRSRSRSPGTKDTPKRKKHTPRPNDQSGSVLRASDTGTSITVDTKHADPA